MKHRQEAINDVAKKILDEGFRVFVAQGGTHGFFTDDAGSRVISFECSLLAVNFYGNYKTSEPKMTGTGWSIAENVEDNFRKVFDAYPPLSAVRTSEWKFTTLEQYLKDYQSSSKYEPFQDGVEIAAVASSKKRVP